MPAKVSKQVGVVIIDLKKQWRGDADACRFFVTLSMPVCPLRVIRGVTMLVMI